jgi:hypothetical protein
LKRNETKLWKRNEAKRIVTTSISFRFEAKLQIGGKKKAKAIKSYFEARKILKRNWCTLDVTGGKTMYRGTKWKKRKDRKRKVERKIYTGTQGRK